MTTENEHPVDNEVVTKPRTKIITKPSGSERNNPRGSRADSNPITSESYEVKDDPKKEARFGKKVSL